MTRPVRRRPIAAAFMTLALASSVLFASPAAAEEPPGTQPDFQAVEKTSTGALPEPSELSVPTTDADDSTAEVIEGSTLPPVNWPAHGFAADLVHLTGAVFTQSAEGTTTLGFNEVRLKAKDAPYTTIASASGGTFAFYNLTKGREYYLELTYGQQVVFSGVTPYFAEAQTYSETTYEIEVILPKPATVSGSIIGAGTTPDNHPYMLIDALRLNEQTGEFERVGGSNTYDRAYQMTGVYPGTYVFRGLNGLSDSQWSDEFYPDGDHLEDAVPMDVHSEDVLTGIDFLLPEAIWSIYRLAGADRYSTSVEISKATFDPGVPVLYVASGAAWPDALSAGPAASLQRGALLLTDPYQLPAVVKAEVLRLAPERVVVVGQQAAVSEAVYSAIQSLVPEISRIGGVDRYDTSRKIVDDAFGNGPYSTVFLATGTNFPDALSVGPIAGRLGQPVLLVNGGGAVLDAPTRDVLTQLDPSEIALIGGTGVISPGIESTLTTGTLSDSVRRLAGSDRYDTNTRVNAAYPPSPYIGLVFVANAVNFPDALAGSTSAAAYGVSLQLSPGNCLTRSTLATTAYWDWDRVVLLGGEGALSSDVAQLTSCEW